LTAPVGAATHNNQNHNNVPIHSSAQLHAAHQEIFGLRSEIDLLKKNLELFM
jgi:hypothetical protein